MPGTKTKKRPLKPHERPSTLKQYFKDKEGNLPKQERKKDRKRRK